MTLSMGSSSWLDLLESEYLTTYIRDGGAAIKFAVPLDPALSGPLQDELATRSSSRGYLVAKVDAASTRIHMVEELFFKVADQVPWRATILHVLGALAEAEGYEPPADGDEPYFRRMASANNLDADFLLMDLRRKVAAQVFRHKGMAKDFRVGMSQLAVAELGGGQESTLVYTAITDWLCGRNRAVSAVKPYQIFSRITRANARFLFESLLIWLSLAGYLGLVLVVDIGRVSVTRNPKDERVFYTRAGVLDAYELLRQFIDATDRLQNYLMVVVPDSAFLDEDTAGRGIGAYSALKFRVYDEVRDKALVNPMASLVRLTESAVTDG